MNRRTFLKTAGTAAAASVLAPKMSWAGSSQGIPGFEAMVAPAPQMTAYFPWRYYTVPITIDGKELAKPQKQRLAEMRERLERDYWESREFYRRGIQRALHGARTGRR